jgi:hypothetical protein
MSLCIVVRTLKKSASRRSMARAEVTDSTAVGSDSSHERRIAKCCCTVPLAVLELVRFWGARLVGDDKLCGGPWHFNSDEVAVLVPRWVEAKGEAIEFVLWISEGGGGKRGRRSSAEGWRKVRHTIRRSISCFSLQRDGMGRRK